MVWIDTQGHEALLLKGAQQLLSTTIPVVIEYWPYALRRSKSLKLLDALIRANYTHFLDTNGETNSRGELSTSSEIVQLQRQYPGAEDATNLILFSL